MSNATVEIDDYTRRGHERFKRMTKLTCGDGKVRTFSQWLEWMQAYDPLAVQDMREPGPGIARRPVKKAAAHKPTNATDKKKD